MRRFVRDRFGWQCVRCRDAAAREESDERATQHESRARFFHEGEAEAGGPPLASPALARRRDDDTIFCPACGAEEEVG